jgi:hypothetical protein
MLACPFCNADQVPEMVSSGNYYWLCGTTQPKHPESAPSDQSLSCRVEQLTAVLKELQPFVVVKANPRDPYEVHLAQLATQILKTSGLFAPSEKTQTQSDA